MPDENTTVEPGSSAPQPDTKQEPTENWKARYDGQVRKIEQLTLENRELKAKLETNASEMEQLRSQLTVKDVEKTAAVSERDKRLEETIQSKAQMEQELAELRALKLKIETVKEINEPGLLKIIDKIPSMTDKEALTGVLKEFADFAKDAAKEREQQLLSGITPHLNSPVNTPSVPGNADEWMRHIESMPLGSKERDKAFEDYWTFMSSQQQ